MANNIKFNVKINNSKCNEIQKKAEKALFLTAEALHTEVVQAQVMPFDTGNLQNESTYVEKVNDKKVQLKSVTPYAKRLYYHPEYKFSKASNKHAQGRWLERWISGSEKGWCQETFAKLLKKLLGD